MGVSFDRLERGFGRQRQRAVNRIVERDQADRLGQLAEKAGGDTAPDIALHRMRGQRDNGNVGGARIVAQYLLGDSAATTRQINVHQDHLRHARLRQCYPHLGVRRRNQDQVGAEADDFLDQRQVGRIVFDVQQQRRTLCYGAPPMEGCGRGRTRPAPPSRAPLRSTCSGPPVATKHTYIQME